MAVGSVIEAIELVGSRIDIRALVVLGVIGLVPIDICSLKPVRLLVDTTTFSE